MNSVNATKRMPLKAMSALESKQREALFLQISNSKLISFQVWQLVFNIITSVIAVLAVSLVLSRPVDNHYFLVDESGRVITEINLLKNPLETSQKVRTFADDCVKSVLNIDFVHYKTQLTNAEKCFTRNGFTQVVNLMKSQGILNELSSGYNVGSVVPRKANFVRSSPTKPGRQIWRVKGSYMWSLQQGKKTVQYPLTIEAVIVAVPMERSVHGMAIDGLTIKRG
ncbi:MAG: DotI/IcmL family type IV secretion protein [Pseudomonadota bacterium]